MKENVADIVRYIDAVEGRYDPTSTEPQDGSIHLGINEGGASVDSVYTLDDGVRWLRIMEDHESHWMIEHGWIECEADEQEFIQKQDLTEMIQDGLVRPMDRSPNEMISESKSTALFETWLDKVDRYLLTNYNMEHSSLEYPWTVAWAEEKTPYEASEEAVLFN